VSERALASAGALAPDWGEDLRAVRRGIGVGTAAKLSANTVGPQLRMTPLWDR